MRVITATLLLSATLAGCVGVYSSEHIESQYEKGLRSCLKADIMSDQACYQHMANVRADAYDYRVSMRRFFSGGGGGDVPVQTYSWR